MGLQRIPHNSNNIALDLSVKLYLPLTDHFGDIYTNKLVSVYGNTTISTSQKIIGNGSAYFDGSGDYLTIPDSDDFNFGSSDFTIDCWVRTTSSGGTYQHLFGQPQGNYIPVVLYIGTTNHLGFTASSTSTSEDIASSVYGTSVLSTNTWYHIALVRTSSGYKVYLNGVLEINVVSSANPFNSTGTFNIGYYTSANPQNIYGYYSHLRVSKGLARWTSNFTPPSSTYNYCPRYPIELVDNKVELSNISDKIYKTYNYISSIDVGYTKLLIPMTGDNNGTVFTDIATNKTITRNGDTKTVTTQSIIGGSCAYFDGTGDYLTLADSPDWDFGYSDNCTIDWWEYRPSARNGSTVLGRDSSNTYSPYLIGYESSGVSYCSFSNNGSTWFIPFASLGTITYSKWEHCAVVKNGAWYYFFRNGMLITSINDGSEILTSSAPLSIGLVQSTNYYYGNLYNFRITKGKALWTSNFTPSTYIEEYTNLPTSMIGKVLDKTYTKLLIPGNGTNGSTAITDFTGKTVTVAGNTNISTAQSIIGGSSIYFDGSTAYLRMADTDDWYFANSDLTIDLWAYFNSFSLTMTLVGQRQDGDNQFILSARTDRSLRYYNQISGSFTIDIASSASVLNLNTWYHISLVRYGSSLKLYINGSSVAEITSSVSTNNFTSNINIGSFGDGNSFFMSGYLSHIRISKGIARWTSNFTPPSKLSDYYQMNNYIGV